LIKYKRVVLPGKMDDEHLVSSGLDILPTLCDYTGAAIPDAVLGRSLRDIAEGRADDWRAYVVTENHTGRMLRSNRSKCYVYNEGEDRESLVDLKNDPGEMKNLATIAEHKQVLLEHPGQLNRWIEQSGDSEAKTFALPVD